MRFLTTKNKIILQFSLISSIILLLCGAVFTFVYYQLIERDMRNKLLHEAKEIINEYLVYENNQIQYKVGSEKELLSEHLQYDNVSVRIYNSFLQTIGNFGIFTNTSGKLHHNKELIDANRVQLIEKKQYIFLSVKDLFENKPFKLLLYPIISGGELIGIVEVAIETSAVYTILLFFLVLLLSLLPMAFIINWMMGMIIASKAFTPIRRLADTMNEITSHNLIQKVSEKGEDHDELVQLSKTFNMMLDRIRSGMEKQKEFVANASHELKTPLTRAICNIDLILFSKKKNNLEYVTKEVTEVKKNLFELNKTLDNLLFLSKMTSDDSVTGVCNSGEIVRTIIRKYDAEIKEKELVVIQLLQASQYIQFPQEYFKIIVDNLLSNAIKYSFTKGVITIKVDEGNKGVILCVSDQGQGMNKEETERIFERFYRGEGKKQTVHGSGLGMSIVKTITDLYQLKISIESTPEKGTKVLVYPFIMQKDLH